MRKRPHFSTLPAVLALTMAWGATSHVWAQSSDPPTLTQLRAQGETRAITFEDGQMLTYSQLAAMSEIERNEKYWSLTAPIERFRFARWYLAVAQAETAEREKRIAAIEADTAEREKRIAAIEADNVELSKQLLVRYEQYVGNMERGAGGEKKVLQQILAQDFVPDALKQRIRSLMAHPGTRWRD